MRPEKTGKHPKKRRKNQELRTSKKDDPSRLSNKSKKRGNVGGGRAIRRHTGKVPATIQEEKQRWETEPARPDSRRVKAASQQSLERSVSKITGRKKSKKNGFKKGEATNPRHLKFWKRTTLKKKNSTVGKSKQKPPEKEKQMCRLEDRQRIDRGRASPKVCTDGKRDKEGCGKKKNTKTRRHPLERTRVPQGIP